MEDEQYIKYLAGLCSAAYLVIQGSDINQFDRLLDRLDDAGCGMRPNADGSIEDYE